MAGVTIDISTGETQLCTDLQRLVQRLPRRLPERRARQRCVLHGRNADQGLQCFDHGLFKLRQYLFDLFAVHVFCPPYTSDPYALLYECMAFLSRRTPSVSCAAGQPKFRRMNPSPSGPKKVPEVRITPARLHLSARRLQDAS